MRVLLVNGWLQGTSGTEGWTVDVARTLRARGVEVSVYSAAVGRSGEGLRREGVEVVDDPAQLSVTPDLVHANHRVEGLAALLCFPRAAGTFTCHDATSWHSEPPPHPRLRRHVAVCVPTQERLARLGIDPARTTVVRNSVDLARFQPRGPLPPRPRRALLLSNYAHENTHLPAVREACRRLGLPLDVVGREAGTEHDRPEELLGSYDLVFAKARSALQAMAVGCAVVVCDASGVGPMVQSADFDRLRARNFGFSTMTRPLDPAALVEQVARYDPVDASAVSARVRAEAGLDLAVSRLVAVWADALAEERAAPSDVERVQRAAGLAVHAMARRSHELVEAERRALRGLEEELYRERDQRLAHRDELVRLYESPTLRALGWLDRARARLRGRSPAG